MTANTKLNEWISAFSESFAENKFVKASLGHYIGSEKDLKNITIKRVTIKRVDCLSFTYRHKTKDIVKNYSLDEGTRKIAEYLNSGFNVATLFTTAFDLAYDHTKQSLKTLSATQTALPSTAHDHDKTRLIDAASPWLHRLGVADAQGQVLKSAQDKFRQVNRYVEVLAPMIPKDAVKIADMGSGKGYLTFALYDYIATILKQPVTMVGIEYRDDLVTLCNTASRDCGFDGLKFQTGSIADYDADGANILIALHACDTATDDAIEKGIKAEVDLIVVAPCCHKQIRRQMEKGKPDVGLSSALRHGIFMERQAEMTTDSIRAMVLEYFGYKVKVFEFISDTHTPKNVMIVAEKNAKAKSNDVKTLESIKSTKRFYGIADYHLDGLLKI